MFSFFFWVLTQGNFFQLKFNDNSWKIKEKTNTKIMTELLELKWNFVGFILLAVAATGTAVDEDEKYV